MAITWCTQFDNNLNIVAHLLLKNSNVSKEVGPGRKPYIKLGTYRSDRLQ
jgi:hypothetical protein